eukprot:3587932-Amphidinium_carterae.3
MQAFRIKSNKLSQSGQAQAAEDSDEYYWKNIMDYMKLNYIDENLFTSAQELHEGVLYYMSIEEIDDLLKRSGEEEEEAHKKMEAHYTDMSFLATGRQRWKDRREQRVHYSAQQQGRRQVEGDHLQIEEDNRKKEDIRKALQREEEEEDRQNKKRERDEQEAATTASSTPKAKSTVLPFQPSAASASTEPPMRTRPPPVPRSQQLENTMGYKKTPATPSVPLLSPRL